MLFISILLSVWFVLWIMYAVFVKDTGKLLVSWIAEEYEDANNDIDTLLEKTENNTVYHLSCEKCNKDWWSIESSVNYCPFCGEKMHD